jgi:uncharacterized repeat protein (TIGR01451 family)
MTSEQNRSGLSGRTWIITKEVFMIPIQLRKKLIYFSLLTGGIVGSLLILFGWLAQSTQAQQGQQIVVDKQLGRPSPVVHVGEYITFTILIDNQTSFTVTTLPLSDTFNTGVLAFVDAVPMPDTVDAGNGRLDWNDLTTFFGDLGPGQQITVVAGFIAEHPAPAVVNRAAVHDAQGSQGGLPGGNDDSNEGESIGGNSPVTKRMMQGGTPPQVGLPITFTITITNNGFTTMTVVPVVDDYDPAFLQFQSAVPQPDIVDEVNGELIWSDLTIWLGDLPAHGSAQITVVFIALAEIDLTINAVSVADGQDWYGNEMGAGADQVPIIIVGGAAQTTATPTATATEAATAAATSTPAAATATSEAQATAVQATMTPFATATAQAALRMPDTGIPPQASPNYTGLLALLAAFLPIAAWGLRRQRRRPS